LVASDPVPESDRQLGHLYMVAEPRTASRFAAASLVRHSNNSKLFEVRSAGAIPSPYYDWAPNPHSAPYFHRRSRGGAFSSRSDGSWNPETDREDSLVDVEFTESGGIRVLVGRMTLTETDIFDGLAAAYAMRLALWARKISDDIGYRGMWDFAFEANGLHGKKPHRDNSQWGRRDSAFDVDVFVETASAHFAELEDHPGTVAFRMVAPLLRGLGSDADYDNLFGIERSKNNDLS
jgi:hypothetical protein